MVSDLLSKFKKANSILGNTALIMASRHGHEEIVEILLNVEGIDVNASNNRGYTALMIVLLIGNIEIAKLLEAFLAIIRHHF